MKEIRIISKNCLKELVRFLKSALMFVVRGCACLVLLVLCVISRLLMTVGLLVTMGGHVAFADVAGCKNRWSDIKSYWRWD